MAQLSVQFAPEDRQKIKEMARVSGLSEADIVRIAFRVAVVSGQLPNTNGAPLSPADGKEGKQ